MWSPWITRASHFLKKLLFSKFEEILTYKGEGGLISNVTAKTCCWTKYTGILVIKLKCGMIVHLKTGKSGTNNLNALSQTHFR